LIQWNTDDPASRDAALDGIRSLPTKVPGILDLREGSSNSPEGLEQGFDYGFVMTFPDPQARDEYLIHPEHVIVGDLIGRNAERVLVFDI
jgi:hypothetical protein